MSTVTKGNVYIAQGEAGGPFKIGVSANLSGRIGMLQEGHPYEIKILAVSFGGGYEFETELHRKYRPWRVRGEWFSEEVLPYVLEDVKNYRWYEKIIRQMYYECLPSDMQKEVDSFLAGNAWVESVTNPITLRIG